MIYPVFTWLTAISSGRWQVYERQKNEEVDAASGRLAEAIGQIRVVKSFVQERRELDHFESRLAATVVLTSKQSVWWHEMDFARRGTLNLVFFAVYAIIFVRAAQGSFTVGVMVLLLQLVSMARMPVMNMSYLVDSAQRAIAGSRDYFEAMSEVGEVDDLPESVAAEPWEAAPGTPAVEFDRVRFGYEDGADVLAGVSFDVHPGERIAFVGESGGGKTTIINLLLRLHSPPEGDVRMAGRNVAVADLAALRSQIGVVFQEASLFSGTVRENVTYGRPDASDDDVIAATTRANAHTFIQALPAGYDTPIGERGIKLSGGQKQRIAIARDLVKDAPILVLDEATSSLGSRAERLVQSGLDELMAGRTSLIVAHRLSTIAGVDRIVTLRNGQVDEIGSREDLATSGGLYSELLSLQGSRPRRTGSACPSSTWWARW